MELVKKNIHMNKWKGKFTNQVTLDDDFNVPDNMADIGQIILDNGEIQIENTRTQGEKVIIKGKLNFAVLYSGDSADSNIHNMAGSIPIEESINVNGLEDKDYLQLRWDIEDLTAGMINSRKLSIKAIITFVLTTESLYDEPIAVDIESDEPIQTLTKDMEVTQIAMQKKDTYRVKEEIQLANNKPNIAKVLWHQLDLRNVECKPLDGKVSLRGELILFLIYSGEEEHIPMQWVEKNIVFSGNLDLPDSTEEMISAIEVRLLHKDVDAKPDYDGENRMLEVDAVLELDMKLYEEEHIQILSDVYSPAMELIPDFGEAWFESLLMKNLSKCRVSDKLKLKEDEKVLQICHSEGTVKIDDIQIMEDALKMEGVLCINMLYMAADDREPMRSFQSCIPFQYVAEAKGIDANSSYQLKPGLEQMTTVMLGNDEVEVKAVITLDILVLKRMTEPMIRGIRTEPLDMEKIQSMPGIVGYIVQPGDSLWNISKKFHTTVEELKSANGLTSDEIKPGDRLLIIKQVDQML